jgi:hypothetical protein
VIEWHRPFGGSEVGQSQQKRIHGRRQEGAAVTFDDVVDEPSAENKNKLEIQFNNNCFSFTQTKLTESEITISDW